jgi:hypothetical protein
LTPTEDSKTQTFVVRRAAKGMNDAAEKEVEHGRTGNAAPKILRDTVLAAKADAAAKRYASTV